eukprot:s565_g7.t1
MRKRMQSGTFGNVLCTEGQSKVTLNTLSKYAWLLRPSDSPKPVGCLWYGTWLRAASATGGYQCPRHCSGWTAGKAYAFTQTCLDPIAVRICPAEGDEALDVIASLEGLWMDSRKDTARRLMRASISSTTSQNSVSSTASLQGFASSAATPHLLRLESSHSGNISDSDSESSSRQSVSNTSSTSITASQAEKLPPFMSHGVED